MTRKISRDYVCTDCEHHEILFVPSDEDHYADRECPQCGSPHFEYRFHINVSTEKLSESIPDVVAKNRFKDIKEQRAWKKEIRKAKNSGKMGEAVEIATAATKAGIKI